MRVAPALAVALLGTACSSPSRSVPAPIDAVPVTRRITGVGGLAGDVSVVYDGLGVPHVFAASDADAAFALGYAQAQDRFFQMDFLRKAARGRLGELFGALADRNQDVFLRTLFTSTQAASSGSHHVEDVIAERLPAAVRSVVERYRDGVNRWLDDVKASRSEATLHPQYELLAMQAGDIAPWTVEDSVAIGRLQSFQLSDTSGEELAAASLAAAPGLDPGLVADLARHAQAVPSVILDPLARSPRAARRPAPLAPLARAQADAISAARASIAGALAFRAGLPLPFARGGDRAGSNNWVVAPRLAASGHALVASDPHLSLSNPPNLYMVHLSTPARNSAGVAFPGTPVIVIGHNDRIAWGATTAGFDVTDLYTEKLDSGTSPSSALFEGAQRPLTAIAETRKVRGQADDRYTILLVPARGPILPGSLAADGTALSVRWTGQDPTFEVQAFHELGAARSVDEAFEALRSFAVGAQNFVVGDTEGHIGYDPHALVPIRADRARGCVPWLPMPGDTAACDWRGFVPDAELPQAKDPARGYLATANNDVTGVLVPPGPGADADPLAAPRYLYAYSDIGFRAQRIRERLEALSQHTLDGMTSIQADDHSSLAETVMPGLLALLDGQALSADAQAVVALWRSWDLSTPRGDEAGGAEIAQRSAAAAAFHAFFARFAELVLGPRVAGPGSPFSLDQVPVEQSAKVLVGIAQGAAAPAAYPLAAPAETWCGGPCGALAATALDEAIASVRARLGSAPPAAWRWGDLHHVRFRSPAAPLLPDFGPFPNDGGLFTVDVANFDLLDGTFEQRSGPNVRMATELEPDGVRSRMVIAGGEVDRPPVAGAPADAHYMDQVPAWLANAPGDQPFTPAEVARAARARVVFRN